MDPLPGSVPIVVAVLTLFLIFITALKYAVENNFVRTRLIMTSFFFFIIITLTVSFWQYAVATLPYSTATGVLGVILGYFVGVRAAEEKLKSQGLAYYMDHFAHVHFKDIQDLSWWSLVNFYSVMSGLLLINLVGLSNVIFKGAENWAIATSAVGAFLLGTIAPYLLHLWSLKANPNDPNH